MPDDRRAVSGRLTNWRRLMNWGNVRSQPERGLGLSVKFVRCREKKERTVRGYIIRTPRRQVYRLLSASSQFTDKHSTIAPQSRTGLVVVFTPFSRTATACTGQLSRLLSAKRETKLQGEGRMTCLIGTVLCLVAAPRVQSVPKRGQWTAT